MMTLEQTKETFKKLMALRDQYAAKIHFYPKSYREVLTGKVTFLDAKLALMEEHYDRFIDEIYLERKALERKYARGA